jgi:hypothetical protein
MEPLVFIVGVLIVVGIVAAIAYYIPFPPPLAWLKWAIPAIALGIAAVMIMRRLGAV